VERVDPNALIRSVLHQFSDFTARSDPSFSFFVLFLVLGLHQAENDFEPRVEK
jgi:hypothetical protein